MHVKASFVFAGGWRLIVYAWLQAEVDFLGQLHHPNLVKLIGYCIEDDQRLLVYEFMARGSLENHLFRRELLMLFTSIYSFVHLYPFMILYLAKFSSDS